MFCCCLYLVLRLVQSLPKFSTPSKSFWVGEGFITVKRTEGLRLSPWNQEGPFPPHGFLAFWEASNFRDPHLWPAEASLSGESPGFPSDSESGYGLKDSPGWRGKHVGVHVSGLVGANPWKHIAGTPFCIGASGCPGLSCWAGAGSLGGKRYPNHLRIRSSRAARPDTSGSLSQVGTKSESNPRLGVESLSQKRNGRPSKGGNAHGRFSSAQCCSLHSPHSHLYPHTHTIRWLWFERTQKRPHSLVSPPTPDPGESPELPGIWAPAQQPLRAVPAAGHGVRDRHKHAASASHRDDPGCSLGVRKQMPDSFSHELGERALRDLFFHKSFRSASWRGGQLRDERAPSAAGRVGNCSRRAPARWARSPPGLRGRRWGKAPRWREGCNFVWGPSSSVSLLGHGLFISTRSPSPGCSFDSNQIHLRPCPK